MSAWVVYGLATCPCPKVEGRRYVCSSHHWPLRWPSTNDERDGPLLIPFDSGLSTHTKPLGHDFANQKNGPQCSVLFPTVLCCDMEHGAQMSVTLCCLLQHKTKGSFTAFSASSTCKRPVTANHCIRVSGCSASNQRPTNKAGNGKVLFRSVPGCDMERGAQMSVYMGRGCHQ